MESKDQLEALSPGASRLASPLLVRSFELNADIPPLLGERPLHRAKMNSRQSIELDSPHDATRPFRLSKYDDIIQYRAALSALRNKPGTKAGDILRDNMSSWMRRPTQVTEEQLIFNDLFANECDRNNTILHTSKGKLEV